MRVSAADQKRVCEAIAAAEAATSGEFVCVLARRAAEHPAHPLAWATAFALILPWPLLALTAWTVHTILLAQITVFALALLILSIPPVRRLLVPRRLQRAAAHRAAAEQFLVRGLAHTPHRRGILLYVALEERYARVLADDGVSAAVARDAWEGALAALIGGCRVGRPADGFVSALDACTDVLKAALPATGPAAQALPDRFFVLD